MNVAPRVGSMVATGRGLVDCLLVGFPTLSPSTTSPPQPLAPGPCPLLALALDPRRRYHEGRFLHVKL